MAGKAWGDLSPDYRRRLQRAGVKPGESRQVARGHGKTPEHPERAEKNPERYKKYIEKHGSLIDQVIAHKRKLFGTVKTEGRHKFNDKASRRAANLNPVTKKRPDPKYMREFLKMRTYDEAMMSIRWSDNEWAFLYYHPGRQ